MEKPLFTESNETSEFGGITSIGRTIEVVRERVLRTRDAALQSLSSLCLQGSRLADQIFTTHLLRSSSSEPTQLLHTPSLSTAFSLTLETAQLHEPQHEDRARHTKYSQFLWLSLAQKHVVGRATRIHTRSKLYFFIEHRYRARSPGPGELIIDLQDLPDHGAVRRDSQPPFSPRALACRSVCKTFQKVIDHSPLLQKNTFLKPRARITSETISHQAYLDQHEIHPLISNLSLDLARNMTLSQLLANEDDVPDTPKLVRLFNVIKHDLDNPTPPIFFRKSFAFGIESGDDSPVLRMYLSNPPSESVLLSVQVTLKRPFTLENVSKHHQLIQVFNRNGVTFRRVIEESKRKIVLGYLAQIGRWAWEMKIQVFSLSGLVESVPQLRNPN
ncbi:hypothetical protein Q7P36_008203 [Cladosporium allicinum]